jgi:pimeloyl-ACP methyl ester carboxylesterase
MTFPSDFSGGLTGFGGDSTKNRAEHRAALRRTPVILVHGNAAHSSDPKFGMETMKRFLLDAGYQPAEIWAMDYLGAGNTQVKLDNPHRKHIELFRQFVDAVRTYLGVQKLDFIAHSLGCGMVNGYLRGLQESGAWDHTQNRLEFCSTFVALAGATFGLGLAGVGEFKSGSRFEKESHLFNGIVDDTPRGSRTLAEQVAPVEAWKLVTQLDDDSITYVAIIADDDFVDAQNQETGRRPGAHLNKRMNLGLGLDGHERIIKSSTVFNTFKPFLNKSPPPPPVRIAVDKDSGSYPSELAVRVTVTPATATVKFVAERVTRQFAAGFIVRNVAETVSGSVASGGTMTLPRDGAWEVTFQANDAEDLHRSYGVNVRLPEVQLLTDNAPPFTGSLEVAAASTRGTLYHSTDREHWMVGAVANIDRTATVSFIAIDSEGLASPIVSRAYEKAVLWTDRQTASLTDHFLAGRLSVNEYVSTGLELGFNAVLTLYLIDGAWVRNPEGRAAIVPPARLRRAEPAARRRAPRLTSDKPSGDYPGPITTTLRAADRRATVYYTQDGSDPSAVKNPSRLSFVGEKSFVLRGNGRHHAILCYVDEDDGGTFEAFAWSMPA